MKAVETLIHGQPNVTDIVFFTLWNKSFLLILALDSKGIINTLKKVLSRHGSLLAEALFLVFAANTRKRASASREPWSALTFAA